jgi:hypothetical protein
LKLGEHQLTIRDFLRHSNLNVANKYLQATTGYQAAGARQTGRRDPADRAVVAEHTLSSCFICKGETCPRISVPNWFF